MAQPPPTYAELKQRAQESAAQTQKEFDAIAPGRFVVSVQGTKVVITPVNEEEP